MILEFKVCQLKKDSKRKYYTGFGRRLDTCIKYLKRLHRHNKTLKGSSL